MLNKNLIRLAASDTTGKAAERKEDAGDAPSVVNEGDIEKLFANTEFFATEADDEDFMPLPDDESEHGGNNTVYPSWWPYNNKTRPEVVLVKNPNVPGGQQVLIKRHFSEANTVMHGGSFKYPLHQLWTCRHYYNLLALFAGKNTRSFRDFYRDMEIQSHMEEEKVHNLVVFGAYANYHARFQRVYISQCAMRPRASSPKAGGEAPGRFILVRIYLTMCNEPRVDFWVYDTLTGEYFWWQGHEAVRHYMCEPTLPFDYRIVQGGKANPYGQALIKRGIWYNPVRMVLRGCKVHDIGVDDPSLKKFTKTGGDPTDQLWEADQDLAGHQVVRFVKNVSICYIITLCSFLCSFFLRILNFKMRFYLLQTQSRGRMNH